ncbi:hypothetical protein BH20CHL7_BH20CHL7_18930 [soil metagenome]
MARVRSSGPSVSSTDAVAFSRRLPGHRTIVAGLLAVALLAGVTGVRAALSWAPTDGTAAPGLAATERLATAAEAFERATAPDGTGVAFTVVSRSTLQARPDGPRIEIPDPADPYRVLGLADTYDLGGSLATGRIVGGDFFLQMAEGPGTPDEAPDLERAVPTLAGLVRDGVVWRNDGDGWYRTDTPPGIGLDPRTVALLPTFLRRATDPVAGEAVIEGITRTTVRADGAIADAPGLMAVDAEPFSELVAPLDLVVDDEGRLLRLTATLRNTLVKDFDLIVVTVIDFTYGPLQPVPDPLPTAPPPKPPLPDPADTSLEPGSDR